MKKGFADFRWSVQMRFIHIWQIFSILSAFLRKHWWKAIFWVGSGLGGLCFRNCKSLWVYLNVVLLLVCLVRMKARDFPVLKLRHLFFRCTESMSDYILHFFTLDLCSSCLLLFYNIFYSRISRQRLYYRNHHPKKICTSRPANDNQTPSKKSFSEIPCTAQPNWKEEFTEVSQYFEADETVMPVPNVPAPAPPT